jgi:hypothetical protein
MAREGNEWRSPVFDIGTAKASSNIPVPKKITRRSPHQNTRATINDRPGTATHGPGGESVGPSSSSSGQQIGSGTSGMRGQQDSGLSSGYHPSAGYTSLNSGGFDGSARSNDGYIPSTGGLSSGSNGYQPRMSTATDSMSTAVEHDNDFEGAHVGKYNVTGSQLAQDPITKPYSDASVASQDPSPRAF